MDAPPAPKAGMAAPTDAEVTALAAPPSGGPRLAPPTAAPRPPP